MDNRGKYYGGIILLDDTPDDLRKLFVEFEEIVSEQSFSYLDEIQDAIHARCSRIRHHDGSVVPIHDLQVCPSNGRVSLRLTQPSVAHQNGTPHASPSIERQSH